MKLGSIIKKESLISEIRTSPYDIFRNKNLDFRVFVVLWERNRSTKKKEWNKKKKIET
jgi:hypothetical protein